MTKHKLSTHSKWRSHNYCPPPPHTVCIIYAFAIPLRSVLIFSFWIKKTEVIYGLNIAQGYYNRVSIVMIQTYTPFGSDFAVIKFCDWNNQSKWTFLELCDVYWAECFRRLVFIFQRYAFSRLWFRYAGRTTIPRWLCVQIWKRLDTTADFIANSARECSSQRKLLAEFTLANKINVSTSILMYIGTYISR